jgi:hypothetical protein
MKRKRISHADEQVNGGPKECTGGLNSSPETCMKDMTGDFF